MIINELWNGDCVATLQKLDAASIDLTVTSPPWDNIFNYGGHHWDWDTFRAVAEHLWRVTKPGGVVCWDIADGVEKGFLTASTLRQGGHFLDLGFRLFEKVVIHQNYRVQPTPTRHGMPPEEVLVFSKGKPLAFHRQLKPNDPGSVGKRFRYSKRHKDGTITYRLGSAIKPMGPRSSIWCYAPSCRHCGHEWDGTMEITRNPVFAATDGVRRYSTAKTPHHFTGIHPARMSPTLVKDLILAYSDPGDLILDPFMGTATTCEMALLNHRFFLGVEIHDAYFKVAQRRVREAKEVYFATSA
jgi:DNA modification methylase